MRVEVVAFAALREALGTGRVSLDLEPGATAASVRGRLAELHPRWRDLIAACRLARGNEFVSDEAPLAEGMEIVLIPPVSGGAPADEPAAAGDLPEVALTRGPLDGDALKRAAYRDAAGAVALFEGTVRTPSMGREVNHLEYEAYEPMALAQMERIVGEARERWPVTAVYLHHRLGRIEVGEPSVVAVASAPHRDQAMEACRHLIERLKADVPIWKKEIFTDGSEWVGAPGECAHDGE
jgi:molybdopterin synthase catalytic subunit/molybdopterin converting factor small subunit